MTLFRKVALISASLWLGASVAPARADPSPAERFEDARAVLLNLWEHYGDDIALLQIAYSCNVSEQIVVSFAMMHVSVLMFDSANRLGVVGDPTLNLDVVVNAAKLRGKKLVADGACDKFSTPLQRGLLRQFVQSRSP